MKAQGKNQDGWSVCADPTVSVIVSCYNYGHFTQNCLESILGQTCPPSQVIVVDDGSTDATAKILETFGDRIEVLNNKNRGQAAAINAGFDRSSGEIVLFVDADDLLRPDAIEYILYHWCSDLAVLTFGLETIDGLGRGLGVHKASLCASVGDNRPELLSTGTFNFPPTSGNAFSRQFLKHVLPMPEPRWRISADCYLIRAAALFGRFDHIPEVLGSYRLHGGNNYVQVLDAIPHLGRSIATTKDVVDAMFGLADVVERFADNQEEADALQTLLCYRARKILEEMADSTGLDIFSAAKNGREPFSKRRPKASVSDLDRSLAAKFEHSRWPQILAQNSWIKVTGEKDNALRKVPDLLEGTSASRSTQAVEFCIDPTPEPILLIIDVEAGTNEENALSEVRVDGQLVWRGSLRNFERIQTPIDNSPWSAGRRVLVEVLNAHNTPFDRQFSGPRIIGLEVSTKGNKNAAPYISQGGLLSFIDAFGAGFDAKAWRAEDDGSAALLADSAIVRFHAASTNSSGFVLAFGAEIPRGWLQLSHGGRALFSGRLGYARSIIIPLPYDDSFVGPWEIEVCFTPAYNAPSALLHIAEVGLLDFRDWTVATVGRQTVPILNLGECVFFSSDHARKFLSSDWHIDAELGGACSSKSEAQITFCVPTTADKLVLRLNVEPLFDTSAGTRHIFAISAGGVVQRVAQLDGPGQIEIPLQSKRQFNPFNLALHSVYHMEALDTDQAPTPAPFVLTSMELASVEVAGSPTFLPRTPARPLPNLQALIERAKQLLRAHKSSDNIAAVSALRHELADLISSCDAKALVLLATSANNLTVLVELGRETRNNETPGSSSEADAFPGHAGDDLQQAALRTWLLSLLFRPAYRALTSGLEDLPAPMLWYADAIAPYFGAAPEIHSAIEREVYRAFLLRLLASVDRILAREPKGSALHATAASILRELRTTVAIFGEGELRYLIRLRSRCIERLLIRDGARLPMPPSRDSSNGKLRLGVLVRDVLPNPEGWALLGMYAGIDRHLFEPLLIRMEKGRGSLPTGELFNRELCLHELSISESVAVIRGLRLNILITGCYVADYEKTSAILAHRLAETQIWHGAVCPTTGGFRSFDIALSCRATEPVSPQRHYFEKLQYIEGPLQCAYAFSEQISPRSDAFRRDLGISLDAVVLASGAMTYKIDDRLLDAWAAILRDAPKAILLVYPFASNWSMKFAPDRFRDRLCRFLRAAGVSEDRVIVLWTQTPRRVREILVNADLYLDSFPYTGATTVCEALSACTPAVTVAGDSLRELTGASWLRAYGLSDLVTCGAEGYHALAVGLANDVEKLAALRARLGSILAAGRPPHNDAPRFGNEFSAALARIANDAPPQRGEFRRRSKQAVLSTIARAPSDVSQGPLAPPSAWSGRAPIKLVVMAGPRTGSTLLCDLLNRTPGVICHFELFHHEMIQYADRRVDSSEALAARNADPLGFLRELFQEACAQRRSVFGFKHFAHLDPRVPAALLSDPETRIVHLSRTNLLAQYSSEKIARQSKRWVAKEDSPEQQRITFRKREYEHWERYQRKVAQERINQLAEAGREALFVEFNEVAAQETRDRLSRFLDVELVDWGNTNLKRQNSRVIHERFDNPEELKGYFAKRGLYHWTLAE